MPKPAHTKVYNWVRDYGAGGVEDKRAVQDYLEAESREAVSSFRAELASISKGNYDPEKLDIFVGPQRKSKHGSYDRWAKMMLLWMADYKV